MTNETRTKKSVRINAVSQYPGCPDTIVETIMGHLYYVGGGKFIFGYDTTMRGEKYSLTIVAWPDRIELVSIGPTHNRQEFNLKDRGYCKTFYGGESICLQNFTELINFGLTKDGGQLTLGYVTTVGRVFHEWRLQ